MVDGWSELLVRGLKTDLIIHHHGSSIALIKAAPPSAARGASSQ